MTTLITIVCEYAIRLAQKPISNADGVHSFSRKADGGGCVRMTISYETRTVRAVMSEVLAPNEVVEELLKLGPGEGRRMSAGCMATIDTPLREIRSSVRRLLELVKYQLRHYDLDESLYDSSIEKWGITENSLKEIPARLGFLLENVSSKSLDAIARDLIQSALDNNFEPLVAMRHLHRAKSEPLPHHKWIDATIAAELAVKEVLCRARPEIAPVLMQVPSPPFSKMYGSLLKHYLGEESPYKAALIAGQERRNQLVHRPGSNQVEAQESYDYVETVESAIFHLLKLLMPQDSLIAHGSRVAKVSLTNSRPPAEKRG